jgi:rubrerythrin
MTEQNLSILDAIHIAKEAEQQAAEFYADAAKRTTVVARGLFEQLAEFERYHYDKLVGLEESLQDQSAFIEYEGKKLALPTKGEVENPIEDSDKMSLMEIVNLALDVERKAERRYKELAEQTSDLAGQAMFKRLAEEEHDHYRILTKVYWNLNDRGVWSLSD